MAYFPSDYLAPMIAAAASFLLIGWWLRSGYAAKLALDCPNERSLHDRPMPRVGGLGIVLGVALSWLILGTAPLVLLLCFLGLAALSYLDDRLGVSVSLRLSAHLAVAGIWVASVLPDHGPAAGIAVVFAIAWACNLYNFMDGSDGLAGGMALIGFSFLALAAGGTGRPNLAWLCVSVAGAALGFLAYNFPPARIFMGDVGSVPLGFAAGAIGSWGSYEGAWPFWLPLLVFAPFLADASVTLARRMWRGERFWHAHRDHYYQRLVRMGWSHRRTALVEYALMVGLGLIGLGLMEIGTTGRVVGLLLAGCVLVALMAAVDVNWKRYLQARERA